jgi:hypothetical protein
MRRLRSCLLPAIAAPALALAPPATAADGVIEINQACAVGAGCLAGDVGGFPVTIASSGSYRLTGGLTNPSANVYAIQVTADNVAIDLNGFGIVGPVVCSGVGTAIACTGVGTAAAIYALDRRHVSVRNGTVRGAGSDGLALGASCRVEGVTVENNGRDGIVADDFCVISASSSRANAQRGFSLGDDVVISHCASAENGSSGILAGGSSVVVENAARQNGAYGISASTASSVSRNSSYSNQGDQIRADASSVVGNAVRSLTGQGWGLNLTGAVASGYAQNTISISGAAGLVTGGVSAGDNVCNGVLC